MQLCHLSGPTKSAISSTHHSIPCMGAAPMFRVCCPDSFPYHINTSSQASNCWFTSFSHPCIHVTFYSGLMRVLLFTLHILHSHDTLMHTWVLKLKQLIAPSIDLPTVPFPLIHLLHWYVPPVSVRLLRPSNNGGEIGRSSIPFP
jgi:hypothetical protein